MPKKNFSELSRIAQMNMDKAIAVFLTVDYFSLVKNKAMPLNQIIPSSIWQTLNQAQKGFVGKVFYDLRKELGFEFVKKGIHGTTNFYRLVSYID